MKHKPEITLHVERDDWTLRGNLVASGDPDADAAMEREVEERLEQGDVWAWAAVEVRAEFRGLSASDTLCGCSYAGEEDFKACPYYHDLVAEATNALADLVADLQGVEIQRI